MEYASDEARRLVQTMRGCHHGRTWAVYCRDCEIVGLRQTYADSIRRARNAERRLLAMGEVGNPPDVRADVRAADEIERLRAELAELRITFENWKVMHSTIRLQAELAELQRIRELLIKSLVRATDYDRERIEEGPLTAAVAHAKSVAECQRDAARYREALERLARLGNGNLYGNSHGNLIAIDALAAEGETT